MANTTRWAINSEDTFEQILNKFENLDGDSFTSNSDEYIEINVDKEIDETFLTEEFANKNIKYNFLNIIFSKRSQNDQIVENNHLIIIYEDLGNIYIVIDKNTGAKKLLRDFLKYSGKGEVSQVPSNVSSEIIVWLISRVYTEDVINTFNKKDLELEALIAFKGNTDDKLSTVSATGDSVMKILSTLSFLLETNSLRQIKLRLKYTNHRNIDIKLDTNNTLDVPFANYHGKYKYDEPYEDYSTKHQEALSILLVYFEIVPMLKQWYNDAVEDTEENRSGEWNSIEHTKFLETVAEDLTNKVEEKLTVLKERSSKSLSTT